MKYTPSLLLGFSSLFFLLILGCGSSGSTNTKDVYASKEMPVQHGMELFNQHCASCHNFSENGIGPNLTGITSVVDKEWIKAFIHNPAAVIESGDARAVELFDKYQQYMPAFPMIAGEDLENILGFIHKFSEGEKRNKNKRAGGLINPIPARIATSPLTLELEEYVKAPHTSEITPFTRINKMAPIPGGRLFIHDLRGKLYEIGKDKTFNTYIDLAQELPDFIDNPGKATGLGSWAFHPDFEKNGLFYTTHNEPAGTQKADYALPDSIKVTLQAVLLEWKSSDPQAATFSGTHRELLRVDMVTGAHTFQELIFNPLSEPQTPDYGLLYLGMGDGGAVLRGHTSVCDNREHIWGKVIRIDPSGKNSTNGAYGIPADNPFTDTPGALGEIWASGFRNAHRISWDETGSGKMFITNIGQHSVEEVNLGKAGANYGWPYREGTFLFDNQANPELVYPLPADDAGYTYPVVQYDHDEGSAVSGGFVYAGSAVPLLKGKYIFGDISRGMLFYSEVDEMVAGKQAPLYRLRLSLNGSITDMEAITQSKRIDLRIGTDQTGELYLMSKEHGGIFKIVGGEERVL